MKPLEPSAYRAWLGVAVSKPSIPFPVERYLVLRTFSSRGLSFFFGMDPLTLHTVVRPRKDFFLLAQDWSSCAKYWPWSAYFRLRPQMREHESGISGVGLAHVPSQEGYVLSIDLCPSHKAFDRRIIQDLLWSFSGHGHPVPVVVSLSGAWLRAHGTDMRWLRDLESSGIITVTWVNHSNRHRYVRGGSWDRNFMRLPGTDVVSEILLAEQAMLRVGVLPSVFFRFPGLVSSPKLVEHVLTLGLLPLASDAWLAKRQAPSPGSIMLIHGNGNEPLGVECLHRLLERQTRLPVHTWRLLDLEKTIAVADGVLPLQGPIGSRRL